MTLAPGTGSLALEWSTLAAASPLAVFATPEWLEAVDASFGGGRTEIIELRSGGQLIGLAPLRIRRRGPLRVLSLAAMGTTGYGVADYGGVIAAAGYEREAARRTVKWMVRETRWDIADLQQLPEGASSDALAEALQDAGLSIHQNVQNICYRIPLPATWEAYRRLLSANTREWLERKPRKLARELGTLFEAVPSNRVGAEYENLHRFVRARHGFDASLDYHRRAEALMASWLPAAAGRGYLRMFRIRAQSRTLGVLIGYEHGDGFYYHTSGYEQDPALQVYSLGACLLSGALRWSIGRGLAVFDMMRGGYAYKARLGALASPNYRILAFRSPIVATLVAPALEARMQMAGRLGALRRLVRA